MSALSGKTVFISGGSRGIGLAIAKACGGAGANVVIAAKTDKPHPKLPGTIHTAADEIREAGGNALPVLCDIRDEDQVHAAVDQAVAEFGGIDAVVNNASAISLTPTPKTDLKRYSLAKYGMSLLSLGWAGEFKGKIAVNCLWPRTTIDTAAVRNLLGGEKMASASRTPEIMGDATLAILTKPVDFSGWFCLDDLVLAAEGVTDFEPYSVTPGSKLQMDFFVPETAVPPAEAGGAVGWREPELKLG